MIPPAITDNPVAPDAPATAIENKGLRYFELCLVLLVALSSSFASSLYLFFHGPSPMAQNTPYRWVAGAVHEVVALALLGYVLRRRGLRFRDLGLQWSVRDCGMGVLVCIAAYACAFAAATNLAIYHYFASGSALKGNTARQFWAHPGLGALPYLLVAPFFEEMIVRAYLMTEIRELTGSAALAVAVSVLVQASYHLYYGWAGVVTVASGFLVFALYYARFRRALPVIVAHELYDLIGFLRMW
jgi:membrane protease YdiL (CAAX protease family)